MTPNRLNTPVIRFRFLYVLVFVAWCSSILAQSCPDRRPKLFNSGYDLVSYHQNEKPLKGSKDFEVELNKEIFRFVTKENKLKFLADPEKYQPQYGGWCAYGIAVNGKRYKVNPRAYDIIDGKLYLFYHKSIFNYLKKWRSNDPQKLILQGNSNWRKVQG